jgi:NAD(P)H-hydrate epimerase
MPPASSSDGRKSLRNFNKIPRLPRRPADAHKGSMGRVLVVAGCSRMPGAAWLAGEGAARAGAGLVTIACPATLLAPLGARVTVQTLLPLDAPKSGCIKKSAVAALVEACGRFDAVAIGPGLSTEPDTAAFVRAAILKIPNPLVVDADALNAISGDAEWLRRRRAPAVVTPHPGEAARLLGTTSETIQKDRRAACAELARRTGAVALLKGHRTVVTDGSRIYINRTGNAGMASGGMGDVLTGVIAAFLARGIGTLESAVLGAHVHGRAGDLARELLGEEGLLATDLRALLPVAIRERIGR